MKNLLWWKHWQSLYSKWKIRKVRTYVADFKQGMQERKQTYVHSELRG